MKVKDLFELDCGVVGEFEALVPHETGAYFSGVMSRNKFLAAYGEYEIIQFFGACTKGEGHICVVCLRRAS